MSCKYVKKIVLGRIHQGTCRCCSFVQLFVHRFAQLTLETQLYVLIGVRLFAARLLFLVRTTILKETTEAASRQTKTKNHKTTDAKHTRGQCTARLQV